MGPKGIVTVMVMMKEMKDLRGSPSYSLSELFMRSSIRGGIGQSCGKRSDFDGGESRSSVYCVRYSVFISFPRRIPGLGSETGKDDRFLDTPSKD